MPQLEIHRAALGRVAQIGALYDARTDCFTSQNIFMSKLEDEAVDTSDLQSTIIEMVTSDSLQDKFEKLDVEGELQMSLMAGMVDTLGSGALLKDLDRPNTQCMSLLYKLKIVEEEIIMRQNKHLIDMDVLSSSEGQSVDATHVVFAIGWGAYCSVRCEYMYEEDEDIAKIKETLSTKIMKLKNLVDSSGSEEEPYDRDVKEEEQQKESFIKCFTDVYPPDTDLPETFEGAVDLLRHIPTLVQSVNNGKGVPLLYTMMPLDTVMKMCKVQTPPTQIKLKAIEEYLIEKCTHVVEDLTKSKQSLYNIRSSFLANSNYVAQKTLDKIDHDFKMFQDDELRFRERLQNLLRKVRSGIEDPSVLEKFLNAGLFDTIDIAWYNAQIEGHQKNVNRLTWIRSWQSKGIIYVGKDEDVNVGADTAYVFYKASGDLDKNQEFFLRLHDEHARKEDCKFIIVDNELRGDLWLNSTTKESIHKYVNGYQTSTDLYTEEGQDYEMCLIQIGTPITANLQTHSSIRRVDVEIGCPNALSEGSQCSGEVVKWKCSKCKQPVQYGLQTKLFYCNCGESDPTEALFRCNEQNHGMDYVKYPDDILAAKLPMKEFNILILGETGVGKSTWINSFINYMTFADLEEASKAKTFRVPIPSSFTFIDRGEEKKILIGANDDNNEVLEPGKSATKYPRCHCFYVGNQVVNLIDTPGIGDSEGIQEDKRNFDNILTHLAFYEEIHAVCILLKPNNSRLTVMFRFCIQELLAHLHLSVKQNIVFCFTNARATFYRPGDTLPTLNQELENRNVGIKATPQNYFCFDNEPFRFLACLSNGVQFGKDEAETYATSWKKSVEETKRLFRHIRTLEPHKVRNTLSMNEARRIILVMSKPLAQVAKTIQHNRLEGEEAKRQIDSYDKGMGELERRLKFRGYDLKRVELDYPRTVCAHPQCVKYIQVGETAVQNAVYEQICHDNCGVQGVTTEVTNDARLAGCRCIRWSEDKTNCIKCGHHFTTHMHITYDTQTVPVEFLDRKVQTEIKEKKNKKDRKAAFKNAIDAKNNELKQEEDIIIKTCAKYGAFLKANAIIPYNDAVEDYLHMCIEQERGKSAEIRDYALLSSMEDMRRQYQEERRILDTAIPGGASENNLKLEDIKTLQVQLFGLTHMGDTLKDIFDGISLSQLARNKASNVGSAQTTAKVPRYRSIVSSMQRWIFEKQTRYQDF